MPTDLVRDNWALKHLRDSAKTRCSALAIKNPKLIKLANCVSDHCAASSVSSSCRTWDQDPTAEEISRNFLRNVVPTANVSLLRIRPWGIPVAFALVLHSLCCPYPLVSTARTARSLHSSARQGPGWNFLVSRFVSKPRAQLIKGAMAFKAQLTGRKLLWLGAANQGRKIYLSLRFHHPVLP